MGKVFRKTDTKTPEYKTLADRCAEVIGSWGFIGFQAAALSVWITLNGALIIKADPYPFILLNLLLSTQAAFATPLLLLSANRQATIDRTRDIEHYNLDLEESKTIEEVVGYLEHIEKKLDELEKEGKTL